MSNASFHLEHCRCKNHADLQYKNARNHNWRDHSEITPNTIAYIILHNSAFSYYFVMVRSLYTHFILPCGEGWSTKIVLSALSALAESRDDPISFIRQDRRRTAPVTLKHQHTPMHVPLFLTPQYAMSVLLTCYYATFQN